MKHSGFILLRRPASAKPFRWQYLLCCNGLRTFGTHSRNKQASACLECDGRLELTKIPVRLSTKLAYQPLPHFRHLGRASGIYDSAHILEVGLPSWLLTTASCLTVDFVSPVRQGRLTTSTFGGRAVLRNPFCHLVYPADAGVAISARTRPLICQGIHCPRALQCRCNQRLLHRL